MGRASELENLLTLMRRDDVRLVTLTGIGGSGKTRLALQAAAESSGDFADGVWFVDLSALDDPELVAPAISRVLGSREELVAYLRPRRQLIVVDNFEQLLGGSPLIAEHLAAAPRLKLLVTSRVPLHLRGEHELPVPPLQPDEAVALFCARARGVRPDFEADEHVAAICRRLDGLPLALELAAARVRALTSEQLLVRLDRRLSLLTEGSRDLPERQRTLRGTIAWSYDLLDDDARLTFLQLSVFAGGCTLDAAEEVCGADLDTLESLVDKSLVRATDGRFSMLETIREFALERLAARGEPSEGDQRKGDCARRRERQREQPIRLRVAAEHEGLLAHAREPALAIEGDRPGVPLPHPEPERLGAARTSGVQRGLHERLRHALPMPRACDVEPLELDRRPARHRRGGWPGHQVRIAHELAVGAVAVLGEEHDGGGIAELCGLTLRSERLRQVAGHVVRRVLALERLAEGRGRESAQPRRIGDGRRSHVERHAPTLTTMLIRPGPPAARD